MKPSDGVAMSHTLLFNRYNRHGQWLEWAMPFAFKIGVFGHVDIFLVALVLS